MNIHIHFDGACHNKIGENNPMGIGIAVFINGEYSKEHSSAIHAEGFDGERGTSNISEWKGCVEAMRKACKLKLQFPGASFSVYSDSQLITNQFNGTYVINKGEFKPYKIQADAFAIKAGIRQINWIRRELNTEADVLSKIGLKEME